MMRYAPRNAWEEKKKRFNRAAVNFFPPFFGGLLLLLSSYVSLCTQVSFEDMTMTWLRWFDVADLSGEGEGRDGFTRELKNAVGPARVRLIAGVHNI